MVEADMVIKKAGNTVFVVESVPPEYLRLMDEEEIPVVEEEPGGKKPAPPKDG
jgi:RNA:NAD 2'-phosphotransferase (TPT1/KptA family)